MTLANTVNSFIPVRGGRMRGRTIIVAGSTTYQSLTLKAAEEAAVVVAREVEAEAGVGTGEVRSMLRGGAE